MERRGRGKERERNITWAIVLGTALWLFCTAYIFIFESIVRCLRVMVRLTEMTFSNLRVPMFAHAGDSEDKEEDREPLVDAVEVIQLFSKFFSRKLLDH